MSVKNVSPVFKCDVCFCDLDENPPFWCWECESNLCTECSKMIYAKVWHPVIASRYHSDSEPSPWGACCFCEGIYPSKMKILEDLIKEFKVDYIAKSKQYTKGSKFNKAKIAFETKMLNRNNDWREHMEEENKRKKVENAKIVMDSILKKEAPSTNHTLLASPTEESNSQTQEATPCATSSSPNHT
jgi:hypothetical protein